MGKRHILPGAGKSSLPVVLTKEIQPVAAHPFLGSPGSPLRPSSTSLTRELHIFSPVAEADLHSVSMSQATSQPVILLWVT